MPRFDFQCLACDTVFEFARSFGDTKKPACPACKSRKTEKMIAPPSIQFKGTGFYTTDSVISKSTSEPRKAEKTAETPKVDSPKSDK